MTWQRKAACGDADPTLFISGDVVDDVTVQREALGYCRRCPVTGECGEWAARDRFTGVAGGAVFSDGRVLTVKAARYRRLQRDAYRRRNEAS